MNRGCPNTARRGGFTLVEVLATLVLLAIILPVAMEGVSGTVTYRDEFDKAM